MKYIEYNKKGFLAPESMLSCANFHAKIKSELIAVYRLNDCNGGCRIWNDLNDPDQVKEMIHKLRIIAMSALEFSQFIDDNYSQNNMIQFKHCNDDGKNRFEN